MMNMISVLDQHARTRPHDLALRAAGQDWAYAELAAASRRAATVLQQVASRRATGSACSISTRPGLSLCCSGPGACLQP